MDPEKSSGVGFLLFSIDHKIGVGGLRQCQGYEGKNENQRRTGTERKGDGCCQQRVGHARANAITCWIFWFAVLLGLLHGHGEEPTEGVELREVGIARQFQQRHRPAEDHVVEIEMGRRGQEVRQQTEDPARLLSYADQCQCDATTERCHQQHKHHQKQTIPPLHQDLRLGGGFHAHQVADDEIQSCGQEGQHHLEGNGGKDTCQDFVEPGVLLHKLLEAGQHLLHCAEGGPTGDQHHEGNPNGEDAPNGSYACPVPPSRVDLLVR
mmetsp:Transcript_58099/g.118286  ORF Transcript_58099/g.118286 Transcript_58099/m.118286 type:complete len:266 (-) Transcript_58099:154-951(-)